MPNLAQYTLAGKGASQRLASFMCHICDLYRPSTIAPLSGTGEMADAIFQPVAAYFGVTCHYEPTPEFDQPELQGLTKETNLLTSDKWHFFQDQEIADDWIIVLKTPGHPLAYHAWITQGNTYSNASAPGRSTDSQWLFAKLTTTISIPISSIANCVTTATATAVVH